MPFFARPRVLPNQKVPHPNKNFFQNYGDHLNYLAHDGKEKFDQFWASERKLRFLVNEVAARLNVFDALRDGYDYFDEVLGATVVPLLCNTASMGFAALALWEGAHALAITVGFVNRDNDNHAGKAMAYLLASVAAHVIAVASLIKSVISLVTRPLVTAIQGYKPQDKDRFYDQEVADRNTGFVNAMFGFN